MSRSEKIRDQNMDGQGRRCFYCSKPIWSSNAERFAEQFKIQRHLGETFKCTCLAPKFWAISD